MYLNNTLGVETYEHNSISIFNTAGNRQCLRTRHYAGNAEYRNYYIKMSTMIAGNVLFNVSRYDLIGRS